MLFENVCCQIPRIEKGHPSSHKLLAIKHPRRLSRFRSLEDCLSMSSSDSIRLIGLWLVRLRLMRLSLWVSHIMHQRLQMHILRRWLITAVFTFAVMPLMHRRLANVVHNQYNKQRYGHRR